MSTTPRSETENGQPTSPMQGTFKLMSLFGIQVLVHYSWLFIFFLLTWSLATSYLPEVARGWTDQQRWIVAALTAILFFASVLAHELSHSLVARARGVPVHSITLFIFGGVSALGSEPRTARDEFWIAIVGPLTSFAAAILAGAVWLLTAQAGLAGVSAVAQYLTIINISVGIFNLLPGFPLDGGRVLRSAVWSRNRNLLSATRIAANIGRVVAGLMIAGGIFIIISGVLVSGFWLIFIGLFLWSAAESSYQQLLLNTTLRGLKVSAVLDPHIPRIPPTASLRSFATDYVLRQNRRAFFVAPEEGDILGIVTLSDLQKTPEDQWDTTTVYRAMTPRERIVTVTPNTEAIEALQIMGERDINQIPVIDGHEPIGMVTRGDLVRAIQLRTELRT